MSDVVTKTVEQTRLYDAYWRAELDANQFVNTPGIFAARVPTASDWKLDIEVVKVEVFKRNPPLKKHEMVLTLKVTGEEDRIDGWCIEAKKLHQMHKEQKQLLTLSPKEGEEPKEEKL